MPAASPPRRSHLPPGDGSTGSSPGGNNPSADGSNASGQSKGKPLPKKASRTMSMTVKPGSEEDPRTKARRHWGIVRLIGASKVAKMRREGQEVNEETLRRGPALAKLVETFSTSAPDGLTVRDGGSDGSGGSGNRSAGNAANLHRSNTGVDWRSERDEAGSPTARPAVSKFRVTRLNTDLSDAPISPSMVPTVQTPRTGRAASHGGHFAFPTSSATSVLDTVHEGGEGTGPAAPSPKPGEDGYVPRHLRISFREEDGYVSPLAGSARFVPLNGIARGGDADGAPTTVSAYQVGPVESSVFAAPGQAAPSPRSYGSNGSKQQQQQQQQKVRFTDSPPTNVGGGNDGDDGDGDRDHDHDRDRDRNHESAGGDDGERDDTSDPTRRVAGPAVLDNGGVSRAARMLAKSELDSPVSLYFPRDAIPQPPSSSSKRHGNKGAHQQKGRKGDGSNDNGKNPGDADDHSNSHAPKHTHAHHHHQPHHTDPPFLRQLKKFLSQEVALRGCPPLGPDEETMEIHRQCLSEFVSRCRGYQALLSRIRAEYDSMLALWREQVSFLGPLRARLAAMPGEAAEREEAARREHLATEAALEAELETDRETIRELVREQEVLMEEHERLTAQVDDAESTLADRQKSNSLLLIGLKNAEESEEKQIALEAEHRRTSEANRRRYLAVISDLEQNLEEYEALKAEVAQMTPRADLEATNRQVNSRQRQLYLAKNNYQQLLEAHQKLLAEYREHADTYASLTADIARLRCRTPRPQWGSVRDYLPPEATVRPHEDSSRDIADALYGEMERVVSETDKVKSTLPSKLIEPEVFGREGKYFQGLGTGPSVPAFLRITGKVRNRQMQKRECEKLVNDVWEAKAKHDKRLARDGKPRSQLSDFLYVFLQKRHGIQSKIAEVGYDFLAALEEYSWDGDCKLFLDILSGQLDEEVFVDQMALLERLPAAFRRADTASGGKRSKGKPTGTLKRSKFVSVLRKFFPVKSEKNLHAVMSALIEDVGDVRMVPYEKLMEEDREGNQGNFVETIREQYLEERMEYLADVEHAITIKDVEGSGKVNASQVRSAFSMIDPNKHPKVIDDHISRGFGITEDEMRSMGDTAVEISEFMKRLRPADIKRCTRLDDDWAPPPGDTVLGGRPEDDGHGNAHGGKRSRRGKKSARGGGNGDAHNAKGNGNGNGATTEARPLSEAEVKASLQRTDSELEALENIATNGADKAQGDGGGDSATGESPAPRPLQASQTEPDFNNLRQSSSSGLLRGVLGTVKAAKALKRSTSKSKMGSNSNLASASSQPSSGQAPGGSNSRLSVGQRRALMLKNKGSSTGSSSTSLLGKHNG